MNKLNETMKKVRCRIKVIVIISKKIFFYYPSSKIKVVDDSGKQKVTSRSASKSMLLLCLEVSIFL
jgi:hypothetical protein